jgi:hypothetical protein
MNFASPGEKGPACCAAEPQEAGSSPACASQFAPPHSASESSFRFLCATLATAAHISCPAEGLNFSCPHKPTVGFAIDDDDDRCDEGGCVLRTCLSPVATAAVASLVAGGFQITNNLNTLPACFKTKQ